MVKSNVLELYAVHDEKMPLEHLQQHWYICPQLLKTAFLAIGAKKLAPAALVKMVPTQKIIAS